MEIMEAPLKTVCGYRRKQDRPETVVNRTLILERQDDSNSSGISILVCIGYVLYTSMHLCICECLFYLHPLPCLLNSTVKFLNSMLVNFCLRSYTEEQNKVGSKMATACDYHVTSDVQCYALSSFMIRKGCIVVYAPDFVRRLHSYRALMRRG